MPLMTQSYFAEVLAQLPAGFADFVRLRESSSRDMSLLRARTAFAEPRAFESYKFLVPLSSEHPREHVDGRLHALRDRTLFAVNPGQAHGVAVRGDMHETPGYLALFVNAAFLRHLSDELFGQEDIAFRNVSASPSPRLRHALLLLEKEGWESEPGREFMLDALTLEIGVGLLRELPHNLSRRASRVLRDTPGRIDRVCEYLQTHYRDDLTLEAVARVANYSPYHLARVFKEETGSTLFQYLLKVKIERAKEMLRFGDKSIAEICFLSGFKNRSHFTSAFKRHVGLAPLVYRRRLWADGSTPRP